MKFTRLLLLVFLLAACSRVSADPPAQPPLTLALPAALSDLPDLGPAPELTSEIWLNSNHPLRLADLRGQVVLLDMWSFG